ncbi:ATP-binding protein [Roseateles violae]|uniref:histidine kinase n=1 Tax=Roseateles violae TaxID=3058042 RepID=A0ABT8DNM7_9BURK|nr:ATP-binding protein [Pelomonas sp. PFR6]MDN3919977.1 ATP-binding protein [Pelomonas sp. PFR6]
MSSAAAASGDGPFDFIDGDSQLATAIRQVDWPGTAVGPVQDWPQSLRSALSICLGSSFPIAIYWGPQLALLYNDDWSPILGSKHPWALGRAAAEVWPEIWDTIGPLFDSVVRTGRATRSTDQLLAMRRHGFVEECYFDYTFSPIRGENGRVEGIFNAVLETTYRVIGERRTRLLRDFNESLALAGSLDEIWTRAAELLASDPHDIPFATLYRLDPATQTLSAALRLPAAAPELDERLPLAQVLADGAPLLVEDLSARLAHALTVAPWPEACEQALLLPLAGLAPERPEGVLLIGISPRLRLDPEYQAFLERVALALSGAAIRVETVERERRRAEQLAELDRAKTVFFSNISHELRTPLTLMMGPLADSLHDERLPPPLQPPLRMAERNAQRLAKLVNALLEFSRIEAGRHKASYRLVDLCRLSEEIASSFRSAMERAGLRYTVRCHATPIPAYVDRDMWERVLLNLLSNALKYTLQGSVEVRIGAEERHAILEVADSGVGIAQEQLPRLFERFHRIEGAIGRTQEGSGIGLALVSELVKLHGGEVGVESRPGAGSTFRVRLPLGKSHLPPEQLLPAQDEPASTQHIAYVQEALRWVEPDDDAPADGAAAPAAPLGERYKGIQGARVIIADDNADMRQYIRRLLEPLYEVETVGDGIEALAAIRRQRPALVVSDVMMPRLDGFGLLKRLREDEQLRTIPLVLVSARAGEEARIEGLDAGADDYLVKPFSARELLARVGAMLALDRMRRVAEEQLRLGLAQARLFTWAVDLASRRVSLSENARQLLDALPLTVDEADALIHPDDAGRHRALLERAIAEGGPLQDELRVLRRDGSLRWLELRGTVLSDERGEAVALSGVSFDITARKQMEESLRLADRRKDEFLAMLAHELRNPLAPIRSASELLRRFGHPDASAARVIEIINRQALQLSRLVDDLLDVSRINRGRVELQREALDLSSIVAPTLEATESLLKARQHRVTVLPSLDPLPVSADPIRLQQSVVNLLSNAAKYTEPGGQIEIAVRREGAEGVLSVTDNGPGIAPELLPDIFDLFVQSDRTLDRSQGGLGIGLSVVKGLVELHGGRVSASSPGLGQGARFEIRLPLVQAAAAQVAAPERPPQRPFRILVVDDNQDAAESLELLLQADQHELRTAFSADDALRVAADWRPEVIFLDIGLPQMDGYEVARRLRAAAETAEVRLVALTGYGQPEDRRSALNAGFDEHLVKPATLENLRGALAAFDK